MSKQANTSVGKRGDVGYCRPPVEHQFKPGQRPPPRKTKAKADSCMSPRNALWKVLHEERRMILNGRPVWISNLELILRKGFELAEKDDNPSISRLIGELMLVDEDSQDNEIPNRTIFDENAPPQSITYRVRSRPGDDEDILKTLLAPCPKK